MEEKNQKITVRDVLIHTKLATSNQEIQEAQNTGRIAITDGKNRTRFSVNQLDDATWATHIQVGTEQREFNARDVIATRERNKGANLVASKEAAITPPMVDESGKRYINGLHREQLERFRDGMSRRSQADVRLLKTNDQIEGRVVATVELAVKFKADTPTGVRELKDGRQYTLIQHEDESYTIAPSTNELRRAEHHKVRIDASMDPIQVENLTIRATVQEAMFKAQIEKDLPRFKVPGKGGITR